MGQAYLGCPGHAKGHATQHRLLAYFFAMGLRASRQQSFISHGGIFRRCTAQSPRGGRDLQCMGTQKDLEQLDLE